ncbi:MAG: sugar ABC transporter ATP-binding protein [Actinobacteria bacterium]|nr:sugar ABC transporter ATP-binding protein [Actinomycetota bacterium]
MENILSIKNLSKKFGGLIAIDNFSIDLERGQIVGIVGDNGAGKSTLIKMISGVYKPSNGEIFFKGNRIDILGPAKRRDLGIEVIYQDLSLADNLNTYVNIFMGREKKKKFLGFIDILDEKYMEEESKKILSMLSISIPSLKEEVALLSGGQRQSIAIARTIYWDAELLIMDEPTAALGVEETGKVYSLIRKLKEEGVTIIIISHNINEIYNVVDRFVILKNGKLISNCKKSKTSIDSVISMIVSGKEA